jgi:hypothetical protein
MSKEGTPISQEDTPRKFERIKRHVKENKERYLIGVSCLAAGYLLRKPQMITIANEAAVPIVAPVFHNNNIGNIVNTTVNNGGYCCKIVQRLEDEELWGKIKDVVEELAKENNVSVESVRRMMDRHFRGELENVFGNHYERIATRTSH